MAKLTEAEFKAAYERLDDMGRRVDAVIAKEKRGRLMPVLNFKPRVMKAKPQPAPEPYDDYQHYETETRPMAAQHYYLPDEAEAPDIANDFFAGFRAEYDKMVKQQRSRQRGARKHA